MGDCGSYFTGFTLASLALMSTISIDQSTIIKRFDSEFFIAIIVLSIPILDMIVVIF